jgi:hypothetical protein
MYLCRDILINIYFKFGLGKLVYFNYPWGME